MIRAIERAALSREKTRAYSILLFDIAYEKYTVSRIDNTIMTE